MFALIKTWRH